MLNNFIYLIDKFGFIPNGNRLYYLSRSQPPFFALMVDLAVEKIDSSLLAKYVPYVEKEYLYWMSEISNLKRPGEAVKKVVLLDRGVVANRYWDESASPRQETYGDDYLLAQRVAKDKREKFYVDIRAAAESGWDFSSRWFADYKTITTIRTSQIIPVDLNCLLFATEQKLGQWMKRLGKKEKAVYYNKLSQRRKAMIDKYCWNEKEGLYFDYCFSQKKQTSCWSLAALFPLFVGIATKAQAKKVARHISEKFLFQGGLVNTLHSTDEQWDYPNGWPPHQWIAVKSLKRYGHIKLANEIRKRWLKTCEACYTLTGNMYEKYNVVERFKLAKGGEYPVQIGFGWTNGVYIDFFSYKMSSQYKSGYIGFGGMSNKDGKNNVEKKVVKKLDKLFPLIAEDKLYHYAEIFRAELEKALLSEKSSLACILNPVSRKTPRPGYGVVVSIGGTNGYVSAFNYLSSGNLKFHNRISFSIPQETIKEELFHLIAKHVLQAAEGRKKPFSIGIGLAYPLRPVLHHGFIDGILLEVGKERVIKGLVGKQVGQEYHKFLISEYGIDTTVMVANDSICLLLGGGSGTEVAGILGTGLNFAYWEKRASIAGKKLRELNKFVQDEIAINIESKHFDKLPTPVILNRVDSLTDNPGRSLSEKAAAGAYLYRLFNAGKDEIIGKNFPILKTTDQVNDILTHAFFYSSLISEKQKKAAVLFADRLFHRSAQVTAIQLSGILLKIKKTRGIIPVIMEGGIFWQAKNFPSLVNLYMNLILPEAIPSFTRLFGSSRRGMAFLARTGVPERE